MSRFLVLLAALAVSWAACVPSALAQDRPRATQVAERVWMVQGAAALGSSANRNFVSNAAFVVTNDSVVVFDALGSPTLAEELIEEIRRVTPLPIRLVVISHYHADHFYGLQAFKAAGARVLAHRGALIYLNSETARLRLQASREDLFPWIDERTRLVQADEWIDAETRRTIGGVEFVIRPVGPAHTPEDLVVYLPQQRTLLAGDLVFRARIPFVGQADSRQWLASLDALLAFDARVIVPGHGPVSGSAREDLQLTRDYLHHLRQSMARAAQDLEPFEEAYRKTDWSRFEHLPLFRAANRINAYNTYLLMEQGAK